MKSRSEPDVAVIGAGVIGLSAAVCVAERGLRVEVRAAWRRRRRPRRSPRRWSAPRWPQQQAPPAG